MKYKVEKSSIDNIWCVNGMNHGIHNYSDHKRFFNIYDGSERAMYHRGDIYNYVNDNAHGHNMTYSNNLLRFITDIYTFNMGTRVGISYER